MSESNGKNNGDVQMRAKLLNVVLTLLITVCLLLSGWTLRTTYNNSMRLAALEDRGAPMVPPPWFINRVDRLELTMRDELLELKRQIAALHRTRTNPDKE